MIGDLKSYNKDIGKFQYKGFFAGVKKGFL
jgi:hypothetical protein